MTYLTNRYWDINIALNFRNYIENISKGFNLI